MKKYDLGHFIFNVFVPTNELSRSEAVTLFAALCGSSYSTVYKWLRDESHFVIETSSASGKIDIEVVKASASFSCK